MSAGSPTPLSALPSNWCAANSGHAVQLYESDAFLLDSVQRCVGPALAAGKKHDAAVRLEELWSNLSRTMSFSLLCGYPIAGFHLGVHETPFLRICSQHSRVIPAKSYSELGGAGLRGLVSRLGQSAATESHRVH